MILKMLLLLISILYAMLLSQEQKDDIFLNKEELDKKIQESMNAFENRPIYDNLSLEILKNINDDDLVQAIIDNTWSKMDKEMTNEFQIISTLSNGKKVIYSVFTLDGEVNNGGFNQYYFNTEAKYYKNAELGLKLIGAEKHLKVMSACIKVWEKEAKKLIGRQNGTIEAFSESYQKNPLNKFDDKYYKASEKDDLNKLMVKYIRSNLNEFIDN